MSVRKGVRLPLEQLQPFLFAFPASGQLLNLPQLFSNNHPVELEVGFGKGAFLIATAPLHPEHNYVGIEIDRGLQLYVANRVAKRHLVNVKLICGDAGKLLTEHLTPASLHVIHLYFPDPWWKKRHHKRRVFTKTFAENCAKILRSNGELHLATDVADYFQIMLGILTTRPEFRTIQADRIEANVVPMSSQTNFEKKALKQGRPVWRATVRRI